jgi:hypothetical protein
MSFLITFQDCDCESLSINSNWKDLIKKEDHTTQTSDDLWQFDEKEIQTGLYSDIIEEIVSKKQQGYTLSTVLFETHSKYKREQWNQMIRNGKVGIDGEIVINPEHIVNTEQYIEFVNVSNDAEVRLSNE